MTFNTHSFDIPHHPADLESKPASNIFDDLDSNLIDTSMLSPATTERKDSFATSSTAYFSPQSSTNPWGDDSYMASSSTSSSHPERHMSISSHFADTVIGSNNPYLNHHQPYAWPVFDRNGSKTPLSAATYEPFGAEFDATTTATFQPSVSTTSGFGGSMPMFNNVQPAAIMPPTGGATPLDTSPPPQSKEYMAMAEQDLDTGRLPKRLRQNSPPRSLTPGMASRRDGVRKKNARFDIPEGRSLNNIDELISQATTEEEVKDLKQQKRLLRNRQAALDSRQRKKKHTEELEREQKIWHEHRSDIENKMQMLEDQIANMRMQTEQLEQERQELSTQVMALSQDKEILVEQHTLETSSLRKKISVLTDQLENSPITVPSQPSSDFTEFTNEVDGLHLEADWENFIMINEMAGNGDQEPKVSVPDTTNTTTTLVMRNPRKNASLDDAQPLAGSLLLMLLLYGAFVASNSHGTGAPEMPGMTEDVRAASAHIVQDILKGDSQAQTGNVIQASRVTGVQAVPSMPAWLQPDSTSKSNGINTNLFAPSNQASSSMDSLASNLLTPSKEAQAEAAFGLTPAQYNSVTSTDFGTRHTFTEDNESSSPPLAHRKGLIDSLRQMRDDARGASPADVYTRSLLWNRIPEHVLQDFRRMVDQRNSRDSPIKDEIML